uniref:Uncharacterized protein n=1 Tax=Meloidogyne javanica TaxID=6303 RepID=A0A915LS35_MELJA
MSNCENGRLQRELEQKDLEMKKQKDEVQNERQQRKRELKAELELLRKESVFLKFLWPRRVEESAAYNRQVGELSKTLNEKVHIIGDLNDKVAQLEAELDICRCQLITSQKEDVSLKAQNAEMTKEVKRLVEELERAEELKKLLDEKETNKQQCNQLRILNRELEAQFNTQMDLIGALKRKLLAQQCEPGKPSWATATATRSCGSQSTEDEQYHSEGSEEGLG